MKTVSLLLIMTLGFLNPGFSQRGNPHNSTHSNGAYHVQKPGHYGRGYSRPVRVVEVRPHRAYINMPGRGVVVRTVPHETVIITRGADRYHYHNGVFYRPYRTGFQVIPAPIGIRVRMLPPGFISLHFGPRPYYYYYGVYYSRVPDTEEYEVVPPPIGARVNALPAGYERVSVDGMIYYLMDGTYYKAVVNEIGEVEYEVVGNKK